MVRSDTITQPPVSALQREQHLLVDWTCTFSEKELREHCTTHGLYVHSSHVIPAFEPTTVMQRMKAFYHLQPSDVWPTTDIRGTVPFRMMVLHDASPQYESRSTSKGLRAVNIHVFDMKMKLRTLTTHPIHATDNIQETKDNLRALSLFETCYTQRVFQDLCDVFDTLHRVPSLQWLIMRNFEDMPSSATIQGHNDINVLVNDYYLIKRILDADAAVEQNRIEDGGYRVLQTVRIGTQSVLFDFRHVGDQYYDSQMQRDMLRTRCAYKMFYVPNYHYHIYSLIYHAVVHKSHISPSYTSILDTYRFPRTREALIPLLHAFMAQHGYRFTRPEPSVGYFI